MRFTAVAVSSFLLGGLLALTEGFVVLRRSELGFPTPTADLYGLEWRYGVILTYSAAWLRQEENQYLDVPPDIAESLSPDLQRMLGYKMNGALGFHDATVRRKSVSPSAAQTEPALS